MVSVLNKRENAVRASTLDDLIHVGSNTFILEQIEILPGDLSGRLV